MKTKKALKIKKALKRLDRVEVLLSKVIDQYPEDELGVREFLDSARTSVGRAKAKATPAARSVSPGKVKSRVKAKSATRKKSPTKANTGRRVKSGASPAATLEESLRSDAPSAAAAVAVRTA
jgi:hypothetical protein